jgi:hypothetical protein
VRSSFVKALVAYLFKRIRSNEYGLQNSEAKNRTNSNPNSIDQQESLRKDRDEKIAVWANTHREGVVHHTDFEGVISHRSNSVKRKDLQYTANLLL